VVAGLRAAELVGVVGEAVARGWWWSRGWTCVPARLIQQALAEGMPAGVRAELHRAAARALAEAGAAPSGSPRSCWRPGGGDGWAADGA